MAEPYFTGDSVPIEFTIEYKGGPITPSFAKIGILKPGNVIVDEVDATIDGNTVAYIVPKSVNDVKGQYKTYIRLGMPYGERTYPFYYEVKDNPEKAK